MEGVDNDIISHLVMPLFFPLNDCPDQIIRDDQSLLTFEGDVFLFHWH